MAKLIGPFKFKGTIDGLTMRECNGEIIVQRKPGPTGEQVLNSPSCELTRRNAGEFKLATKNSALLRRALGTTLNGVRDSGLSGRMIGLMHRVSRTDVQSEYGYRHAGAGDLSLLTGFDFNKALSLDKALPIHFEHRLDVVTGTVRLEVPSFIARRKRDYPKGATHFRIVSCAAVVDFVQDHYANSIKATELLPLGKKTPATICQDHRLTVQLGEVLLQVMGIEFYSVVDGKAVLLKGGAMRILEAVKVERLLEDQDNPISLHTQAVNKTMKPYTAKDLQELTKRLFRQQPVDNHPFFTMSQSFVGCHDPVMEKTD